MRNVVLTMALATLVALAMATVAGSHDNSGADAYGDMAEKLLSLKQAHN